MYFELVVVNWTVEIPYIGATIDKMGRYFLHCVSFATLLMVATADDLNRQSIVFYDETPDVFYCPQEKPVSLQGTIQIIFNLICI